MTNGISGTLGERIRALREDRRLSASELARRASVTPTAVWNWENNGIHPRPGVFAVLATILGVSQDFLLTGKLDDVKNTHKPLNQLIEDFKLQLAGATGHPVDRINIQVSLT